MHFLQGFCKFEEWSSSNLLSAILLWNITLKFWKWSVSMIEIFQQRVFRDYPLKDCNFYVKDSPTLRGQYVIFSNFQVLKLTQPKADSLLKWFDQPRIDPSKTKSMIRSCFPVIATVLQWQCHWYHKAILNQDSILLVTLHLIFRKAPEIHLLSNFHS